MSQRSVILAPWMWISSPGSTQEAHRKNNAGYLGATSHSPQWALAPDSWDAYRRKDLHLPINRKLTNSLPWGIYFSLIKNSLLMFRLSAPCCKFLYKLTPHHPIPPPTPTFGTVLFLLLEILSPWLEFVKTSYEIKHNCQEVGIKTIPKKKKCIKQNGCLSRPYK